MCGHTSHSPPVRGQTVSVLSPIFVLVLVIKLRSSGLCAQHLYLLSHLPSPVLNVEVTH